MRLRILERAAMVGVSQVRLLQHREHVNGGNLLQSVIIADNQRPKLMEANDWKLRDAGVRQISALASRVIAPHVSQARFRWVKCLLVWVESKFFITSSIDSFMLN